MSSRRTLPKMGYLPSVAMELNGALPPPSNAPSGAFYIKKSCIGPLFCLCGQEVYPCGILLARTEAGMLPTRSARPLCSD